MEATTIILIVMYFLPAVVATCRGHHNQGAIFALNLLLGWTLLGWVAAFVWACTASQTTAPKVRRTGLLVTRDDVQRPRQESERERHDLEAKRREKEREAAKWDRLRSETLREPPKNLLPPLPKVAKQRGYAGAIVIGGMAVIALALSFVGVTYVIGTEPPAVTQVDYTPQ